MAIHRCPTLQRDQLELQKLNRSVEVAREIHTQLVSGTAEECIRPAG
jgi:hypothetical protein